jgi:hypothetical protein
MIRTFTGFFCTVLLACSLAHAEPVTAVSGMFTVDTTPPTLPSAMAPADGQAVSAPFLRLQARSTDALSGVAGYEFQLVSIGSASSDANFAVFHGVPSRAYDWSVRAVDAAGNLSDWASFSCTFSFGDDADGDGLPDSWENASFGSTDYSDGTRDSDGDGMSDLEAAEADIPGYQFYVTLEQGWNMIALPCNTTPESVAALVAAADGPIWVWDAACGRYGTTNAFAARQGFWLFSAEREEDIPVFGTPATDDFLPLAQGWNLAGAGFVAGLESPLGIASLTAWEDNAYYVYAPEGFQFSYLQGYWVRVTAAGDRLLVPVEE